MVARFQPPGLQAWLVAALIGVGMLAATAVLVSVFPTVQNTLRRDAAQSQSRDMQAEVQRALPRDAVYEAPDAETLDQLANAIAAATGAQVRVVQQSGAGQQLVGASANCCELVDRLEPYLEGTAAIGGVTPGFRYVWARSVSQPPPPLWGTRLTVTAVARSRAISDQQLSILRGRLILAVTAVLLLAALAGYGLSRLVGKRIAILARTAARLAGGDLAARAPSQRLREFSMLGESLNTMAGRIENQVDQITRERDRAGVLISSLAEGVIGVDDDGTVTIMNPAAKRLLGVPPHAALARSSELPASVVQAVAQAARDGEDSHQHEVILRDGTVVQLFVARLAQPAAGVVITMRDVTETRRLERARRDLVANVSHELKTPLAAIKGLIELLQGPRVTDEDRTEFVDLMEGEAARLERLVEEQLQLARLDSGGLPLERERFDLDALADGVVASRRALAEVEGVRLRAVATAGPVPVFADPARVEQILLILLDNALRHTPAGGQVEVLTGRDGTSATLAVADTGEGIPLIDQPFVFDRFYRGDRSREGRSAGLGLAIARGLAQAHGGVIDLVSAPGAGSTFTLRLPVASSPTAEHPVVRTVPEHAG